MFVPCQIVHWYFMPTVVSRLSIEMMGLGLSQKEIATALFITPAAISQYVKKKRGVEMNFPRPLLEKIKSIAIKLKAKKMSEHELATELCEVCKFARKNGLLCDFHRKKFEVSRSCRICE